MSRRWCPEPASDSHWDGRSPRVGSPPKGTGLIFQRIWVFSSVWLPLLLPHWSTWVFFLGLALSGFSNIYNRYSRKSSIQKCKCSHLKGPVLLSCSSSVTHNSFSKVLRRIAEGISKHSRYWHLRQTNLTINIRLFYHSLALWFGAS